MRISSLNTQQEIQKLESDIQYHDRLYWTDNNPEISDEEYDQMHVRLKELKSNSPVLTKIHTPTVRSKGKVIHDIEMQSLDKAYTIPEVIKFAEKFARSEQEKYLIQPKYDGISGEQFEKVLSTRGDGKIGDDITDKSPLIDIEVMGYLGPIEQFIQSTSRIRGEIIMKFSKFNEIKDKVLRRDGSQYTIPRAAVVGLLGQKTVDPSIGRVLTFVEFNFYNQILTLEQMRTYDWTVFIDQVRNWDYPTDGLVIKLADIEYRESLGSTSHHPRGQIALKHGNPRAETTINGVEWSMGKRKLTPVGLIEPITLAGAVIKRVSLHNAKFILDKNLHFNDQVIVERCGEIIPHVVSKANKQNNGLPRTIISLSKCPECGGRIEYREPELYCLNEDCTGKLLNQLNDSVSRLGIDYLAKATIEKMIDNLGVKSIIDILTLTEQDISLLDGFKEQSTSNLKNEIDKIRIKPIEDWRILSCLNLKGIGKTMSKKLLSRYSLSELRALYQTDLEHIDGIGPERAKLVDAGLIANRYNIDMLIKMFPSIIKTKGAKTLGNVCFTGKSTQPRNYWKQKAEAKGYNVCSSVSKDVGLLVTNNPNSQSTKMKKARKQGTKIISYEEFEAIT